MSVRIALLGPAGRDRKDSGMGGGKECEKGGGEILFRWGSNWVQ